MDSFDWNKCSIPLVTGERFISLELPAEYENIPIGEVVGSDPTYFPGAHISSCVLLSFSAYRTPVCSSATAGKVQSLLSFPSCPLF